MLVSQVLWLPRIDPLSFFSPMFCLLLSPASVFLLTLLQILLFFQEPTLKIFVRALALIFVTFRNCLQGDTIPEQGFSIGHLAVCGGFIF